MPYTYHITCVCRNKDFGTVLGSLLFLWSRLICQLKKKPTIKSSGRKLFVLSTSTLWNLWGKTWKTGEELNQEECQFSLLTTMTFQFLNIIGLKTSFPAYWASLEWVTMPGHCLLRNVPVCSFINNNPASAQELNFEARQNMNKRLKPRSTSGKLLCSTIDKNVHSLTWIFTIPHGHILFNFHFLQQRFKSVFLTSSYPPSLELLVSIIVVSDLCLVRHLFPF